MIQRFTQIIQKGMKDETIIQDPQEFPLLTQMTDRDYDHMERLDPINTKCRYSDISTFKDNKVPLKSIDDYINASWVHIPAPQSFIATQGPISTTIQDFWTMIFDYDVKIIVMLCNLVENSSEKCFDYWNTKMEKYTVEIITENNIHNNYIERKFKVSNGSKEKKVTQLHFIGWPDGGIPEVTGVYEDFENMIQFVKENNEGSPVVTHCSAGVGRTGTFIAMYNLYYEIKRQMLDNEANEIRFSVFGLVRKMKEMRMYLVQTESQYYFIYYFIQMMLQLYNS